MKNKLYLILFINFLFINKVFGSDYEIIDLDSNVNFLISIFAVILIYFLKIGRIKNILYRLIISFILFFIILVGIGFLDAIIDSLSFSYYNENCECIKNNNERVICKAYDGCLKRVDVGIVLIVLFVIIGIIVYKKKKYKKG